MDLHARRAYRMSCEFTLGVEEEYQLVDAESGALASRARDVLATDWTMELRPELQETTLEIGTPVCASAAELDRELRRLRFQVAATAAAVGLDIVAAGMHPFSRWESHQLARGDRYREIAARYGRVARDEHNFGMHVHVAVAPGRDRIRLLNVVRHYLPHLIALACSSPYFEGEDTGYASFRMVLWRRWPTAGVPPRLASEKEYEQFTDLMLRTTAIGDPRGLYWGVRPHALYPTLEFRVTDACPRVEDAVAIAALVRALVAAAAEGLLREPRPRGFSRAVQDSILAANEWRAMRYGLAGSLVDPEIASGQEPVGAAVRRLVDRIAPVAEALGDTKALEHVDALLGRGNGADRMRAARDELGGLRPLIRWLTGETLLGTGLDRRSDQRFEPPA